MTPDPISVTHSSTGLSTPVAAALTYSAWWVTGGIFWWLERRDRIVRFHAAQAIVTFGAIAMLIVVCALLAVASLSLAPSLFAFFASAAALAWTAGVVLSGISMWKVACGDEWRIPVAAEWAERLNRAFATTSAAALP
jgi:uncharacterized membrane protein